uniref:Uncharacterized protein n=1 Tax=Ixodes ricinus TaxID=34613 RepID=A0A6B0UL31_IXORI
MGHWMFMMFPLPRCPFRTASKTLPLGTAPLGVWAASGLSGTVSLSLMSSVVSSDLLSERLKMGFSTPASGRGGLMSLLVALVAILMLATLFRGACPFPLMDTGSRLRYFLFLRM